MDKRFEELLTPEAVAKRQAAIDAGPHRWDYSSSYHANKQTQDVVDAREKLEELSLRLAAHKANGEAILEWLKNEELPGVDCWIWDVSEIQDDDIVGNALQWAASNHNC